MSTPEDTSAKDVANWMLSTVRSLSILYQELAVTQIQWEFGDDFVYDNANGNLAIAPDVLKAFRKLSGDEVVWVKSERCWRLREEGDEPGREQP